MNQKAKVLENTMKMGFFLIHNIKSNESTIVVHPVGRRSAWKQQQKHSCEIDGHTVGCRLHRSEILYLDGGR